MTPTRPRGMRDLLPPEADAWEWVRSVHKRVASLYGYRQVVTPVIETAALFPQEGLPETAMYRFNDHAGRPLVLRPDGVSGVLRAVHDAPARQRRPLRLRYAGPMFRYSRPQHGIRREFTHLGLECIGTTSLYADVEVIEAGVHFTRELGLDDVTVFVNTVGDEVDRHLYKARLTEYFGGLVDQLCERCRRRLHDDPRRILACPLEPTLVATAPVWLETISDASRQRLESVLDLLRSSGVPYDVRPSLVRGPSYYIHTVFTFMLALPDAGPFDIGGGERYDLLAERLALPPTPGVGCVFGVERMLEAVMARSSRHQDAAGSEIMVLALSPGEMKYAADIARRLRADGLRVEMDLDCDRRPERRLRLASLGHVRFAVLVGQDEERANRAVVRDLGSRLQVATTSRDLPAVIRRLRSGASLGTD